MRTYGIARALSSSGADVATLHYGPSQTAGPHLEFRSMRKFSPFAGSHNYLFPLNPFFRNDFKQFLRSFHPDIIQCEQPWATVSAVVQAHKLHLPLVIDEHNVEFVWSVSASRLPVLSPFVCLMEKFALSTSVLVLAVSERDKRSLRDFYKTPPEKIHVCPNGIDTARFNVSPDLATKSRLLMGNERLVLFHGSLRARQNEEAAELIISRIAPAVPDATFVIAGEGPSQALVNCAKGTKNVVVLGPVPRIEALLVLADICVAPLVRGAGTKFKLLDYMTAGKPIVATYKAAEGLPLQNGVNAILLKGVDESFANAVERLLSNENDGASIGSRARLAATQFDWGPIGRDLHLQYGALLSEAR